MRAVLHAKSNRTLQFLNQWQITAVLHVACAILSFQALLNFPVVCCIKWLMNITALYEIITSGAGMDSIFWNGSHIVPNSTYMVSVFEQKR